MDLPAHRRPRRPRRCRRAGTAAESNAPEGRHLDWPGQITGALAIAASIYGVIEGGSKGWSAPVTIAGLCVGAAAFAAFIMAERRSDSPLLNLTLHKSPVFTAAGFSALIALFSVVGVTFLLSLFLGYVQHLSALQIGWRLPFITGVAAVLNPVIGRVMHKMKVIYLPRRTGRLRRQRPPSHWRRRPPQPRRAGVAAG